MLKAKALKEEKDWDGYWTKRKTKSQTIYKTIASFYRKRIIKKTLNYFIQNEFENGSKLLHAGCGTGQVDQDIIANFKLTALDISGKALNLYKTFNGEKAKLVKASIFKIPAKNYTFDGIYNLGVMEHFTREDNEKILKELSRVLKPNGKIVLFWPPKYGVSVIFLNTTHFILNNILKRNIKLHPEEISLIESKKQVEEILQKTGFKLQKFYFGPKDLFTHCVVIARKK
jgi:ubiquinone/menaquinone biosynthesis C-methylase UbiE